MVTISAFDGKPITIDGELMPSGSPLFQEHKVTVDLPRQDAVQDFDIPASRAKR